MIRLLEHPQTGGLPAVGGDVFGARILSAVQMYGAYPFCDVWVQQENGVCTAAISRLEGAMTIAICAPPDWQELQEFFRRVPAQTLLGEGGVMQRLGFCGASGTVLSRHKPPGEATHTGQIPRLQDVHGLLRTCAADSFAVPDWEPFYLDLSHRLRHGGAYLTTMSQNGMLAACAMTVAQTAQMAVLGAVAVHPEYRGQGMGSEVVRRLLARLPQTYCAVLCAPDGPRTFYENLGFHGHAVWTQSSL